MKSYKHLLILLFSLMGLSTFAQTSKKTLNYQAVILDPKAIDIPGASITGQPLNKGNVCLRFSLLNAQGGLDYEETQQVTTDEYGLVSVAIGAGAQAQASNSTSIYKSFDSVLWNSNVKSLKVSVSYDGCNSFKQVSSQALNYTPYALYAEAVDYKNVREAPTKLSQFSNDAGYLIPKDLDPLKSDIQTNSSKIEVANKSIADNKQASDATFLVVNQSITSLDTKVADNKKSSDAAFLVVNQSITSLDAKVAENTMAIKENTSSITTINTKITDQQNQISDNRNQIAATNSTMNTQIGGLQGQLNTTNSTVSNLSGTAEVVSNKSTAVDLGGANPSDQLYPSQKAAKSYIDNAIYDAVGTGVPDATTLAAGKVKLAGDLGGTAMNPTVPALANKENSSNKSTSVQTDGTNDTKYPSVKAVKDYVDQATMGTALQATVDGKADKLSPTFTGTPTAPTPTSTDNSTKLATTAFVQAATAGIALQAAVDAKANINSPTFTGTPTAPTPTLGDNSTKLATTAYVDAQVSAGAADATTTSKGIVKLTGDLGGTATSPTVPGLLLKEDVSNKSDAALGTSTTLYPTQNAVKTYVDAQVASATIADANATTKGKLQLTGDLGGTASSPTVPGLTTKANIASPTFTGTVTSPIYASAPQNLTDAATISWNPANGLNANVTLGGDRTLSFSATPTSGSYGTLVVTQDGSGGRTLTLPSGTNKVLGSASTTTIALSSAANAKDILNFYFDGTTYFWNIGQGYGTTATITANNMAGGAAGSIPYQTGAGATGFLAKGTDGQILTLASGVPSWTAASATGVTSVAMTTPTGLTVTGSPITSSGTLALSLATGYAIPETTSQTNWNTAYNNRITSATSPLSISSNGLSLGTVPVSSGGTGATTLTSGSLLKGNGTSAISAATAGTDYSAGTSTLLTGILKSTTITGALTIAAASDFPTLNQNTTGNASTATKLAASKNINGVAFDGSSDITISASAGTLSGTVAVANGGTGATTLTANNVLLGNGTSAVQAVSPGTTGNVLTSNGTTWTSAAPSGGGSTTYSIGDSYGGGIVFYVTSDGKHGLISETQLISPNANSSSNSDIYYYSQAQNMISDPDNHSTNGKLYTDWRLPTKSEFARLYAQRALFNSNYPNYQVRLNYYVWTSTPGLPPNETSKMTTFYQGNPGESNFNAGNAGVIAIRSF